MILSFDKFERYEVPQVTLCNPNSRATEVDGKITITDTVGMLSNPKEMNLKLNFNAPHELSFDYYRHKSTDSIKQSFYDSIYEAIQTDRYIYLTDIGYFTIKNANDSDEDNIDKKSISLKSCEENELATAEGLYLKKGTYYLHTEDSQGLLDLFLPKTAGWTMGYIDPSLLAKPYYVEETEVDNGYNFLYTTVQDMFECIVEPDIIKRTISVYSRVYYAEHHLTDIHIAKYNLLKHKTVEENDEDKYTALNVQGKDENLEIRVVNPTGKNIIYNFEPRYSWMSKQLQEAIEKWQKKCESVENRYLELQQGYYAELEKLFNEEKDIEVLNGELERLKETKDIAFTMADGDEKDQSLANVNKAITAKQKEINSATSAYNAHKKTVNTTYEIPISQINSDCALDTTAVDINGNVVFTVELLNELMTHIKPTDYVDEYMLVTESMTYPQRFEKAKELMDRAQSQLVKISSGQKTYSIDTRSFLFNKQFKHFSEQLCAGAIIYVETKSDKMEQLHLTGIDMNFDEKSTNFTLGNKYDRSDLKALYEDALGQYSKSFSELKYIASIIEDQQKQLDYQRNWVADLRTLTLNNVLTSEDQAIEINNRGLTGRKRQLNADGSWKTDVNGNPLFDPEQVKLINNTLVFTDNNWDTAATAVGKIAVGYDSKGNVKYAYGINGQVLIGELILGNNLVLTGTGAGIKIKDGKGNNAFYADDEGNLVLSGKIFATSGEIAGWNMGSFTDGTGTYSGSLHRTTGNYRVFLRSDGSSNEAVIGVKDYSTSDNGVYKFYVQHDGYLYSTYGNIAGWNVSNGAIQKYNNGYRSGIASSGILDNAAFYAGTNNESGSVVGSSKFYVTHGGYLYASDGNIAGWNISSSGFLKTANGKTTGIQPPGVGTNAIAVGSPSASIWDNAPFRVTHDGKLYSTSGSIGGWDITSGGLSKTANGKTTGIQPPGVGTNAIAVGSPSASNWDNAPFRVTHDGKLHATGAMISGTLQAGTILSNGVKFGTAGYTTMQDRFHANYPNDVNRAGTLWVHDASNSWIWLGNRCIELRGGVEIYMSDNGGNLTSGTWRYNNVELSTTGSDIKIKHSINLLSEKYANLFDDLQPVTFIYNFNAFGYGTSQRTHIGFIANEVENAMHKNNINNMEFAGLVIQDPDTEQQLYTLRYEEFIALNTWQIQRCKSRIADLENTVAELKTQIQTLTAG